MRVISTYLLYVVNVPIPNTAGGVPECAGDQYRLGDRYRLGDQSVAAPVAIPASLPGTMYGPGAADCVVAFGGDKPLTHYPAHRAVLAAASAFFRCRLARSSCVPHLPHLL
jgi:hypothetical protein